MMHVNVSTINAHVQFWPYIIIQYHVLNDINDCGQCQNTITVSLQIVEYCMIVSPFFWNKYKSKCIDKYRNKSL